MKHNMKEINLQIKEVETFSNECYSGLVIKWTSNIGDGCCDIFKEKDKDKWDACNWNAEIILKPDHLDFDALSLDCSEKDFVDELMKLFTNSLIVLD